MGDAHLVFAAALLGEPRSLGLYAGGGGNQPAPAQPYACSLARRYSFTTISVSSSTEVSAGCLFRPVPPPRVLLNPSHAPPAAALLGAPRSLGLYAGGGGNQPAPAQPYACSLARRYSFTTISVSSSTEVSAVGLSSAIAPSWIMLTRSQASSTWT